MSVKWVFDPAPPSGQRTGGKAAEFSFKGQIDTLVREVVQNSLDARQADDRPVSMVFRVVDLRKAARQRFLDAMGWSSLQDNFHAVPSKRGGMLISRAIDVMETSDLLRLLVIEDRATKGLEGTERRSSDEETNSFCALVRDELYSDKDRDDAAGSFGLGKSLLWAYSSAKTVLFASVPRRPPQGRSGVRFIGRTSLPYHETKADGRCSGDGWLGIARGKDVHDRYAESIWGDQASELAAQCWVPRQAEEHGLSAAIVGFSEPGGEEERTGPQLLDAIESAVLESFWPAICRGQLKVDVRYEENARVTRTVNVDPATTSSYAPAVSLLTEFDNGKLKDTDVLQEGASAVRWVPIEVPERTADPGHTPFTGQVAVAVHLLPEGSGSEDMRDKVFRFRKQGMVIRSAKRHNLSVAARPYVALVLAGAAGGASSESHRVEAFLRAAEPPAHDEWTHNTRAIKALYKSHGVASKLQRLEEAILEAIRSLVSLPEEKGGALPSSILRHLRFGTKGGGAKGRFISVTRQRVSIVDDAWKFHFSCRRIPESSDPWHVRIRLKYGVDGGGADDVHAIDQVSCAEAVVCRIHHGDALLEFPATVDQVDVTGTTSPRKLPAIGTRAAVSLQVDGREGGLPGA